VEEAEVEATPCEAEFDFYDNALTNISHDTPNELLIPSVNDEDFTGFK
jgi:hypothetical protein